MKYLVYITNVDGEIVYWRNFAPMRMSTAGYAVPYKAWTPKVGLAKEHNTLKEARVTIGQISDFFGLQSYRVLQISNKLLFEAKLKGL